MVPEDFKMKLLPQSLLHLDVRGDGDGSCLNHVLRRHEVRKQEKEAGRGVQAVKKDEPDQSQKRANPKH